VKIAKTLHARDAEGAQSLNDDSSEGNACDSDEKAFDPEYRPLKEVVPTIPPSPSHAREAARIATPVAVLREKEEARAKDIAIQQLFLALDQNGDGAVDVHEFLAFLRIGLGLTSSTLEEAEEALAFKDLDKDGMLSRHELAESCSDLDAAAIWRLCEPLEREAGLHVYHAVQVEPPQSIVPSPWLASRCTPLCTALPVEHETHELIITSSLPRKDLAF